MEAIDTYLRGISWPLAAALALLENVALFAAAIAVGHALKSIFVRRSITNAPPITRLEMMTAAAAILVNSAVTVAGLALWRAGIVRFRNDVGPRAWLDVLILVLIMDAAMYLLHRVAHVRWIFPLLHALHHRYDRPRPLTLFVLSPIETISFGGLWLVVIAIYPSSWLGMSIYLALNVAFGTLGHIGVEPFPSRWVHWPIARHIGTSTFHAQHHARAETNFGFYTLIWDRLFGTLHPDYEARFGEPIDAIEDR